MIDAIRCVLMYHFDQIKSKKSTIIYYINIDYNYTPGYALAIGYFAPRVNNILYVMGFYHILHKNSFGHL